VEKELSCCKTSRINTSSPGGSSGESEPLLNENPNKVPTTTKMPFTIASTCWAGVSVVVGEAHPTAEYRFPQRGFLRKVEEI